MGWNLMHRRGFTAGAKRRAFLMEGSERAEVQRRRAPCECKGLERRPGSPGDQDQQLDSIPGERGRDKAHSLWGRGRKCPHHLWAPTWVECPWGQTMGGSLSPCSSAPGPLINRPPLSRAHQWKSKMGLLRTPLSLLLLLLRQPVCLRTEDRPGCPGRS